MTSMNTREFLAAAAGIGAAGLALIGLALLCLLRRRAEDG